jgi:hypothetical protein
MAELGRRLERAWNPRVPGVLNGRHHTEILEWLLEFMTASESR